MRLLEVVLPQFQRITSGAVDIARGVGHRTTGAAAAAEALNATLRCIHRRIHHHLDMRRLFAIFATAKKASRRLCSLPPPR